VSKTAEERRATYYDMSTRLAHADNAQLVEWLGEPVSREWGSNTTIKLGRTRVFVKRIPVTAIEHADLFSTRNHFDLPTYYNYGIGSAGFGAFRELLAHIKTTNWELEGRIENFPLLYHYRIVPRPGRSRRPNKRWLEGYVQCWGGSESIGEYTLARAKAKHEIILFLEHVPDIYARWIAKNPDGYDAITSQVMDTIAFLRANGMVHFDAHWWNILTDGERAYVTDFGLVVDRQFDLSDDERSFFKRHRDYDAGIFLSGFGSTLTDEHGNLSERKKAHLLRVFGVQDGAAPVELLASLLDNLDAIHADGTMKLADPFVRTLHKYRDIIELMFAWLVEISGGDSKDVRYSHTKLKRMLAEAEQTTPTTATQP